MKTAASSALSSAARAARRAALPLRRRRRSRRARPRGRGERATASEAGAAVSEVAPAGDLLLFLRHPVQFLAARSANHEIDVSARTTSSHCSNPTLRRRRGAPAGFNAAAAHSPCRRRRTTIAGTPGSTPSARSSTSSSGASSWRRKRRRASGSLRPTRWRRSTSCSRRSGGRLAVRAASCRGARRRPALRLGARRRLPHEARGLILELDDNEHEPRRRRS